MTKYSSRLVGTTSVRYQLACYKILKLTISTMAHRDRRQCLITKSYPVIGKNVLTLAKMLTVAPAI